MNVSRDPSPAISKDRYEADFLLLDRYQAFTAELLRLSLLGIGGVGYFADKLGLAAAHFGVTRVSSWFALFGFAVSVGGSLAHRYYSSDGMHHHLRAIRFPTADASAEDRRLRTERFVRSTQCIAIAVVSFGFGAVMLALAFVFLLWPP